MSYIKKLLSDIFPHKIYSKYFFKLTQNISNELNRYKQNNWSVSCFVGVRYKCVNCVDYDVCAKCEPNCDHDITHVLMKISIPIPPLANPRTTLLSVLYPGIGTIKKLFGKNRYVLFSFSCTCFCIAMHF